MQPLRDHIGSFIKITSSYRSEAHNAQEGGKPNSHHLFKQDKCAVDFQTEDMVKTWKWLKENRTKFCYAYWDKKKRFIHLSGLTRNDPRAGKMWIDDENGRHFEMDYTLSAARNKL